MDDPELEAVVKTWLETVYVQTGGGSTASFDLVSVAPIS